jgi:uncharacterized protein YjbI with pentapeptide repeats
MTGILENPPTLPAHASKDAKACAARHRTRRSAIGAALLLLALPTSPALAECNDEPGPEVDWSECQKARLMFGSADLSNGEFVETFFTSTDLAKANLAGSDLSLAEFSNARLAGADLTGAVLEKAVGSRVDFSGANMAGANLTAAEFSRSNFQRANLVGADLTNSELSRSDFTEADLTGAIMAKAELPRIVLASAVVSGVTFSFSNLARADLRGVNFDDADFTGSYMFLTVIEGADLSRTKGLKADQLEMACGSAETQLPSGLSAPEGWPCPAYHEE